MKMERIAYGGWSNCVRIGNGQMFVHRAEGDGSEASIGHTVLPLVQAGGHVNA